MIKNKRWFQWLLLFSPLVLSIFLSGAFTSPKLLYREELTREAIRSVEDTGMWFIPFILLMGLLSFLVFVKKDKLKNVVFFVFTVLGFFTIYFFNILLPIMRQPIFMVLAMLLVFFSMAVSVFLVGLNGNIKNETIFGIRYEAIPTFVKSWRKLPIVMSSLAKKYIEKIKNKDRKTVLISVAVFVGIILLFNGTGDGGKSSSKTSTSISSIPSDVIAQAKWEAIKDNQKFVRVISAEKVGGKALNGQTWKANTEVMLSNGEKTTIPYIFIIK